MQPPRVFGLLYCVIVVIADEFFLRGVFLVILRLVAADKFNDDPDGQAGSSA